MFLDRGPKLYLPTLAETALAGQSQALLKGMHGFVPIPVDNLLQANEKQVRTSLGIFLNDIPATILPEFMKHFTKAEAELDPTKFCLSPVLSKGTNSLQFFGDHYTWLDAYYGFTLGYREGFRTTWLASTSFSSYHQPLQRVEDDIENTGDLKNLDKPEGPYIKQLQAYHYYNDDHNPNKNPKIRQQKILQQLRWERLLVVLTAHWAESLGFSAAYLQQGKKNHYYGVGREERFHMRYDVTAQRLGFKLNEYGDYQLNLR